ncbi:DUF2213 domain-containing protein [Brevibacillus borstelensis]|uniref:DUF2213 domain-containing protein n=1 Tax=Brevibacillus borstelensis TaxID=45462 RepID=UPI00287FC991|nr:DUF2213 domain-containing protein [Brevibacillus borstelensis]WNF07258.1 DUF2213 domain-containing protein [Brevibacillus borstelensis]
MRAFYGSRFSPNMTETPEGFLICHNVPIARTGWYEYLDSELGVGDEGKIVKVYRSPEEVFSPAAIASFEGKILTDEHPPVALTSENATWYTKGAVQNVRQGKGENDDLLMADLVVHDQALINEIQEGKREVSCGYECVYEAMSDGTYHQKEIRGNHVAVVKSGRAGDRVAIKDSKEERSMKKKITLPRKAQSRVTDLLAAIGLKQFAQDAEPEEIKEAVDALTEERVMDEDEEEKREQTKDEDPAIQALAAQVQELKDIVAQLVKKEQEDEKPEDAIDQLISELEKEDIAEDEEEESHTVPVESMMDEEGPVAPAEERPQSALDNAYKIAALKEIKPIIAAIPDLKQRKQATDAAIAAIRKGTGKNTYAAIQRGQRKVANDKKKVADSNQQDFSQLGKEWAKKFNPHYKDRA